MSAQFTSDQNLDGLLGLSFSVLNTIRPTQQLTWFDNVKENLAAPLFCADLRRAEAGSYDFGYIDTSAYTGDIHYTEIDNSQGFWMMSADGYAIGGGETTNTAVTGIADTGTTLLLVQDSLVEAYYAEVPGAELSRYYGAYVFPCDANLPDFSLIIDGNAHTGKSKPTLFHRT